MVIFGYAKKKKIRYLIWCSIKQLDDNEKNKNDSKYVKIVSCLCYNVGLNFVADMCEKAHNDKFDLFQFIKCHTNVIYRITYTAMNWFAIFYVINIYCLFSIKFWSATCSKQIFDPYSNAIFKLNACTIINTYGKSTSPEKITPLKIITQPCEVNIHILMRLAINNRIKLEFFF